MNSASLRVLYCIIAFLLHSQNHKLTVIENSGFWASGEGKEWHHPKGKTGERLGVSPIS